MTLDLDELRRRMDAAPLRSQPPAWATADEVTWLLNEIARLTAALEAAKARLRELEAENDRLKAILANSNEPCIYCNLPRDRWVECRSGFPDCARSDDYSVGELIAARALSQKGASDDKG